MRARTDAEGTDFAAAEHELLPPAPEHPITSCAFAASAATTSSNAIAITRDCIAGPYTPDRVIARALECPNNELPSQQLEWGRTGN